METLIEFITELLTINWRILASIMCFLAGTLFLLTHSWLLISVGIILFIAGTLLTWFIFRNDSHE